MAIKHTKRKAALQMGSAVASEIVVVGNYKTRQLDWIKKNGVYNWPVREEDDGHAGRVTLPADVRHAGDADGETGRGGAPRRPLDQELANVKELWLYANVKSERHVFTAQFVGKMSQAEFLAAYPSYAKLGPSKQKAYYVFKTTPVDYPAELGSQIVLARTADFGKRCVKVKKAVEQFKQDGEFAPLAAYLPKELGKVPRPQLRVCEAAVQYDFIQLMYPQRTFPAVRSVAYTATAIKRNPKTEVERPQTINGAPFKLGEFFCGPGGLACGALSATIENPHFKIEHAWSNDYDQQTCDTYAENICHDNPETVICHDVRKLDLDDRRLTPIDGFAFGFPCNDFSVVGEHKGIDGNYGPLYQYGVAVLKKFKPMWFLAENVGGLASANEGSAFKMILAKMKEAGYRIYPHLYKFEDYGVPQTRHRIIIIGIRNDLPYVFSPPSPAALEKRDISSRVALEVPPIPPDAPNNELTSMNQRVVERLRFIRPGENAFTAKLPEHLQLKVHGAKISQIYKRLHPDKPSYTVTGSGGGGTHIYHYAEPRALTNRERARLQTFPDDYLFTGSKESVRRQIGMAVPPRGARIIFEAVLRTLAGIEYEHVDCNISQNGELK